MCAVAFPVNVPRNFARNVTGGGAVVALAAPAPIGTVTKRLATTNANTPQTFFHRPNEMLLVPCTATWHFRPVCGDPPAQRSRLTVHERCAIVLPMLGKMNDDRQTVRVD